MESIELEDIFTSENGDNNKDEKENTSSDFFSSVLISQESEGDLSFYDDTEAPQQKTKQEILRECIDTSPILSVAEIRAKFSKGKGPLFPKQMVGEVKGSKVSDRVDDPSAEHYLPAGANDANFLTTTELIDSVDGVSSEDNENDVNTICEKKSIIDMIAGDGNPDPDTSSVEVNNNANKKNNELLSSTEFNNLCRGQNCDKALKYYTTARKIHIIIQSQGRHSILKKPKIIVKEMQLKYNPEQRLLMILRQESIRYIRLADAVKIDVSKNCCPFKNISFDGRINQETCVAMYFRTTKDPMVIVFGSEEAKDNFYKLVIFLRRLIKTHHSLDIIV